MERTTGRLSSPWRWHSSRAVILSGSPSIFPAVSKNPKTTQPAAPAEAHEASPLELAESSEGSTLPVDAGRSSVGDVSASAGPAGGTSTGGFDTMLGKLIIHRGLATEEEIQLCNALMRESAESEQPHTLADLLIDNRFITPRQLERIKSEFEAKKSTEQIPGYKIKQKIGSGAMATVFLAKQLSLDRMVAIKVLPKKLSANTNFIDRFYKEGRAAAQLNHPNIVGAYDVGKAGNHHYFVMEYVDGRTLYDHIAKGRPMEEPEAINIVRQVAEALQHAHERGFIHRDVKPKNIMLNRKGTAKLADLGLARAMSDKEAAESEAGRAYGTPYYISPEQIRGEVKIGPAADIYGLGATFYHMVTGRVPYEGKNPSAVMHKHLKQELTPPDHVNDKISANTALVIEKMMAKNPKDRYERVADLLVDLNLIAGGQAPHFAHHSLDLSQVTPALPSHPGTPVVVEAPRGGVPGTGSTLFLVVLVVMIVSLLVNLILALVAVT